MGFKKGGIAVSLQITEEILSSLFDLDFCFRCGYPLIFRNYEGDPHHPLHIPTGWYCWQGGSAGPVPAAQMMRIPLTTPGLLRSRLFDQATKMIRQYLSVSEVARVMQAVRRRLGGRYVRQATVILPLASKALNVRPKPTVLTVMSRVRDRLGPQRVKEAEPVLKLVRSQLMLIRQRDAAQILRFVANQVADRRYDVAGQVVKYLALQDEPLAKELAGWMVRGEHWQEFLERFPDERDGLEAAEANLRKPK